jgi:hypothetical protein
VRSSTLNVLPTASALIEGPMTTSNTVSSYGSVTLFNTLTGQCNSTFNANFTTQGGVTTFSNTGSVNIWAPSTTIHSPIVDLRSNVTIGSNLLVNGITTLSNTVRTYGITTTFADVVHQSNVTFQGGQVLANAPVTFSNVTNFASNSTL